MGDYWLQKMTGETSGLALAAHNPIRLRQMAP